jgi:exodeoxyribonuclease V gamma subunit
MQPFSPQNFGTENPRIFSYRGEWSAAATMARSQAAQQFFDDVVAAVAAHENEEVDLDELRVFFHAPARIFLRDKLATTLDRVDEESPDEDPLSVDGLHKYALRHFLADSVLSGESSVTASSLRARGLLPVGAIADRIVVSEQSTVDELTAAVRAKQIASSTIERFELSLGDGRRLSGRLPPHDMGRAFRWRAGSFNGKHLLNAWIDFLALAARVENAEMNLLGIDGAKIDSQRFAGIDRSVGRRHLSTLVSYFDAGMSKPLLFFPATSLAYVECLRKQKSDGHDAALEAARKTFETDRHSKGEAVRVPEFALLARDMKVFEADSPSSRIFADTAVAICAPLLDALESP